jgi:PAS domain S-box-containing protein
MAKGATPLGSIEEMVHAGTWAHNFATSRCTWSAGLLSLLGASPASLKASTEALFALVHEDDRAAVTTAWDEARLQRAPFEMIHRLSLADGRTKIVLHRAVTHYRNDGTALDTSGILVNITNQQLIRTKLDDATATLMAVWEHVPEGLILVEAGSGTVTDANPFAERILGLNHEDVVGAHFTEFLAPERRERSEAFFARISISPVRNVESVLHNGPDVEISTSGTFRVGEQVLTLASLRDISERRQYERSSARLTAAMAAAVRLNAAIARATSPGHVLQSACDAIVGGSVVAACIVNPDVVRPIICAGPARAYFDDFEAPRTQLPRALHVSDPEFARDRQRAIDHGIYGTLVLPVPDHEFPQTLSIYTAEKEGFAADEIALFSPLAMDIALALRAIRSRDRLQSAVDAEQAQATALGAALRGALGAVSATLEKRDPFTVGHEQRVAELTKLIAVECSLDSDTAAGLYLAATVHDIGKISVPAEILTRPGKFTPLEYEFVKLHARTGYDILSGIAFPWDIAGMVHQHHEVLDGSGYPLGLRRHEISLPVRILTVADIVEAMSAFRPYHAAATLEAVVETIVKMGKKQLDPEVVASCVRVIERGEFKPANRLGFTVESSA